MKRGELKPFTCDCGKVYPVDPWTAAHWHEALQLKCDCGRLWHMQNGVYDLQDAHKYPSRKTK